MKGMSNASYQLSQHKLYISKRTIINEGNEIIGIAEVNINWSKIPIRENIYNIFVYSFTVSDTAFSTIFLMRAFADICVNMMFVAIFMNEYVSYFDSWSLINHFFAEFYAFPSN